jgi:hypothetical protein
MIKRLGTAIFIILWIVRPYGSQLEFGGFPENVEGCY